MSPFKEIQRYHVHVTEESRDRPYAHAMLNAPKFSLSRTPIAADNSTVGKCLKIELTKAELLVRRRVVM